VDWSNPEIVGTMIEEYILTQFKLTIQQKKKYIFFQLKKALYIYIDLYLSTKEQLFVLDGAL